MSRAERLAEKLLQDRELAKQREAARRASRREPAGLDNFDPFEPANWVAIAGSDPGYLPTIPMRKGPVGWHVACRACGQEFESKGLAFCAQCLEIPAEERRLMKPVATGRLCQATGCENFLPKAAKANTRYCSDACQQRAKRARRDRDNRAGHPDSPQPLNATQNAPGSRQRALRTHVGPPRVQAMNPMRSSSPAPEPAR